MKYVLIKLAIKLLSDEKTRGKVLIVVLSVVVGFLGLLFLPLAVLLNMDASEPPQITAEMSLTPEQRAEQERMDAIGKTISDAMYLFGVPDQTIKAQLIYVSFFEDKPEPDYLEYAGWFALSESDFELVARLNLEYDLNIVYEEFMKTYTFVMNQTINPYLFTDANTKNAADLAAWAKNAYVSGWGYADGTQGNVHPDLRYRTADNGGLILGYLNYNPSEKVFGNVYFVLGCTEQGTIDTMPAVDGIGVYDGTQFGILAGGEVYLASTECGYVTKLSLADQPWINWCTFEGIAYPKEVQDTIAALQAPQETQEGV